ncbi:hypothetical protein PHIZP2_gp02 [Clostridium phage phiZP2]|uniref:Uncharacterized protein n=1 Tax=Clostridium phage phiZP2 TaxID=1162306 RepID=I3PV60_9CAUD|nr:hypothetical protein PHIZP2_gp02 [Clostridium phage phiZP2]AFH27136.1 hypothetical protein phiZP2_002 [Clostridium phage phiZP2]
MYNIIQYKEKFLGNMIIELDRDSKVTDMGDTLLLDKATYTWTDKLGKRHRYRDFNRELDKERIL